MTMKELKEISELYSLILKNKRILSEDDIAGIDELVYNPLTGPGKPIGHGYDSGKKKQGITWSNHDDHLHIGFTNREVAMAVIDKADSLGLRTTENPYAKKDPNGKVDNVHTKGSFHYKTFAGEPKVGGGVDISGDTGKIEQLIRWVESTYANSNVADSPISQPSGSDTGQGQSSGTDTTSTTSTSQSSSSDSTTTASSETPTAVDTTVTPTSSDSYVTGFAKKAINTMTNPSAALKKESINEANLFGGKSFKWGGGPSDHGGRSLGNWQSDNAWDIMAAEGVPVYSISNGTVKKVGGSEKLSKNGVVYGYQVSVDTDNGNSIFYTHIINLPSQISPGSKINKGDLMGYIGKPAENPKWPTHVHIGIKKGDISQFIDKKAEIIGADSIQTDGEVSTDSGKESSTKSTTSDSTSKSSVDSSSTSSVDTTINPTSTDTYVSGFAKKAISTLMNPSSMLKKESINESFSDNGKYYLTFCNTTSKKVKDGDKVSSGQVIGIINNDVDVNLFDEYYQRDSLKKGQFNLGKNVSYSYGKALIPSSSNTKLKSPIDGTVTTRKNINACVNQLTIESEVKKQDKTPTKGREREIDMEKGGDELVNKIVMAPVNLFKDRYDDSGKLVQKRWGHTGEKVDPWIVDTLSAPFKKIGKFLGTNKKVNEEIERIKSLMK